MDALANLEAAPLALPAVDVARLVAAFLEGRNARTRAAYAADLADFAAFLEVADVDAAATVLLERGHGAANELALSYRAHLVGRGLAPATVNRRLAALRSLVKLARVLGRVGWTLEVPSVKSQSYRDTRGPGVDGFRRLLAQLDARVDAKAKRDRAALRLLFDLALRRAEVCSLDLAHLDLEAGTLAIMGKGRTERERLTLPGPTRAALAAWVAVRGTEAGPLFTGLASNGTGGRLTGTGLYLVVRDLGLAAGLKVRPHGLRHAAITAALEATSGDVRRAQRFSRHRDLRILSTYDDNRADLAGEVAAGVAGLVP